MPTLYELLKVNEDETTEVIKQKIYDELLTYDDSHGDDVNSTRHQLRPELALLLLCYETLCETQKRSEYDKNPKQYANINDIQRLQISGKCRPKLLLGDHIDALAKEALLHRDNYYSIASFMTRDKFTTSSTTTIDAKIKLLSAKYLLRHLYDEDDNSPGNLIFNTHTIDIAVELFIKAPRLQQWYNSILEFQKNGNLEIEKFLEITIGGENTRKLLTALFFSKKEDSFNKIRWLANAITFLEKSGLDSPSYISLLIYATQKESFHLVGYEVLHALLQGKNKENLYLFKNDHDPKIATLESRVDEMFTYGFKILLESNKEDHEKGLTAMKLALDLKEKMNDFIKDKSDLGNNESCQNFKISFVELLHSKDEIMSQHRALWKVIITNILIALTGVGILAIGVNLAINHRFFCEQTKREAICDSVKKEVEDTFKI